MIFAGIQCNLLLYVANHETAIWVSCAFLEFKVSDLEYAFSPIGRLWRCAEKAGKSGSDGGMQFLRSWYAGNGAV